MLAIKKRSLVDMVYDKLRESIIELKIPLGSKLNVNELQERMGVSCTPIREAINRLQQEGLVVYENNVGAHIISLEPHDVLEIQQLAMTLHCAAIRLAMANGDRDAIVTELRQRLAEYTAATTTQEEVAAINAFLGTYYHNCGNHRLDHHMLAIQGQQMILRHIFASCIIERGVDAAMFRQMLDDTVGGDAEAVCRTLQRYTDRMTLVVEGKVASEQ